MPSAATERVLLKKTSPPSIPSKFMTYHYDTSEKKAFNKTSRRFSAPQDELPGPGHYCVPEQPGSASVSLSKKGLGGFASKTTYRNKIPTDVVPTKIGPGQYDLTKEVEYSRSLTTNPTSAFCQPVTCPVQKTGLPGPGDYDTFAYRLPKHPCSSVNFKSRAVRAAAPGDVPGRDAPAPGHYEVNYDFVSTHTSPAKTSSAAFKTSKRRDFVPKDRTDEPGPGSYDVVRHEAREKPASVPGCRRVVGSIALKPPLPRPRKPLPGPGQYEVQAASARVLPHSPESFRSVFKSTSPRLRLPFDVSLPGPGCYWPRKTETRGHFRLKVDAKWVC